MVRTSSRDSGAMQCTVSTGVVVPTNRCAMLASADWSRVWKSVGYTFRAVRSVRFGPTPTLRHGVQSFAAGVDRGHRSGGGVLRVRTGTRFGIADALRSGAIGGPAGVCQRLNLTDVDHVNAALLRWMVGRRLFGFEGIRGRFGRSKSRQLRLALVYWFSAAAPGKSCVSSG